MSRQTKLPGNWSTLAARMLLALASTTLSLSALTAEDAPAAAAIKAPPQDAKCMECHDDIFEEKVIHAVLAKGCGACHDAIDASKRPHKNTGKFKSGLNSAEPELCLSCHERIKFKNKSTHEALDKGCSACHEAHSGKHNKLLKSPTPELCFTCHDKKGFSGKGIHDAVKSGNCRSCHDSHASPHIGLLKKPPVEICLDCHDDIKEAPHVVAGFSRNGHPIGDEKRARLVEDPLRPGKPFYCVSCHQPHRGDFPKLQRIDPKLSMGSCQKCHQM